MAIGTPVTLRLTIEDPVPGVAYSLCNKANHPVGRQDATDAPLSFDVPVRVAPGPRWLGDFVRAEGPTRRFVYISIGTAAGDFASCWSRRAKIDIQDIPAELVARAEGGAILETIIAGRGKKGDPACATVGKSAWRVL